MKHLGRDTQPVKYLRRGLKALGWLLLALLVLAAALLAWVAAINWRDEPLSDAARAALTYTPPTGAQLQGNGYLILAGLDAATDGSDPIAAATELGRQRLAREIERRRWVEQHGSRDTDTIPPAMPAAIKSTAELMPAALRCPPGQADCFGWYAARTAEIDQLASQHQPVLQRLAAAASAPRFSNDFPYYLLANFAPYAQLSQAHQLWLAQAATQWVGGQRDHALNTVREAVALRQRLASQSGQLVEAMMALALQYRELRWLGEAAAQLPAPARARYADAIDALLATPPPSLRRALEGEKAFMAGVLHSMNPHGLSWLASPPQGEQDTLWQRLSGSVVALAFLPQATLNRSMDYIAQVQAMSELPPPEIGAAFSRYFEQIGATHGCAKPGVRNATGHCLAAIGASGHQYYALRLADIDGFRRLALLSHRAAVQQVPAADMPAWLAKSPADLHNPYTLAPMHWDAATHSLVFEGRQRQAQNPGGSATYRFVLASR